MDEKTILLFDDYLQGALSQEDRISFETRLKNESELKDAFTIFKDLNGHLRHTLSEDRAAFKKQLDTLANAHFPKMTTKEKEVKVIRFKPMRYLVAACVVMLFGIIFWFQMQEAQYSDYAFDGTIDLVERGGDTSAFAKAEKAFNTESYEEAVSYFNTILSTDPNNSEVLYYKGIAQVELGAYEEANSIFNVLQKGSSIYTYKATWYAALSNLKQGNTDRCKQLLEKIPPSAEDYERGQELLKKL